MQYIHLCAHIFSWPHSVNYWRNWNDFWASNGKSFQERNFGHLAQPGLTKLIRLVLPLEQLGLWEMFISKTPICSMQIHCYSLSLQASLASVLLQTRCIVSASPLTTLSCKSVKVKNTTMQFIIAHIYHVIYNIYFLHMCNYLHKWCRIP